MSQIQVRDQYGRTLPLIHYTVSRSANPDDPYLEDFFVDYAGNSSWPHMGVPYNNVYLHVNHFNKNAKYQEMSFAVNHPNDIFINLNRTPLTRIKPYAFQFNIGHLRINTDFRLYQRWLDGQNITDILLQRSNCGSGGVRTFGMTSEQSFGHKFKPGDYGDSYYNQITMFASLLNSFGLYWYFTVFADTQLVMPSLTDQQNHFNRVVTELTKCDNVLLELVNEYDQHSNFVDRTQFSKPTNITSCSGSCGSRNTPTNPHWDIIDYHSRRDYPGSVTEVNTADYLDSTGHSRAQLNIPIGTGEPWKLGTGYETDLRKCFETGQSGFGVSPLNCFHSQQGVNSELFDSTTESCAKAFFGV